MKDRIFKMPRKIWRHQRSSQYSTEKHLHLNPEKTLGLNEIRTRHDLRNTGAVLSQLLKVLKITATITGVLVSIIVPYFLKINLISILDADLKLFAGDVQTRQMCEKHCY